MTTKGNNIICKPCDLCVEKGNMHLIHLYEEIFEKLYNWIVVVDREGYIILINKPYANFLGVDYKEVIGKHVTDVIENTRMHIVIRTGKKEIGDIQKIKNNQMIADRIPIFRDDELIGAVGTVVFKNLVEFGLYVEKIDKFENEIKFYKEELKKVQKSEFNFEKIIGESQKIKETVNLSKKVAVYSSNILITGESGTGKEMFAHAIHNESLRANQPLVKVNCAAIPSGLLESELFGYEYGAFTGSKKGGKIGKFELADKSTIFLDEIGELPMDMQAKILRVIQEREIDKVGGTKSQKIDVRIITATNRNLEERVKEKVFREDLYYRLNVINIELPALRERKKDIPILLRYFIKKFANEMGCHVADISPEALQILLNYKWPGNIRELSNIVERAINLVDKEATIMFKHLPYYITKSAKYANQLELEETAIPNKTLKQLHEDIEKKAIQRKLEQTVGNKYKTAKQLDISRTSLYKKMKKYNIGN
ncbi:MAG: sigma-54 interaction domain-containing protein [Alkaliphilus sp.]